MAKPRVTSFMPSPQPKGIKTFLFQTMVLAGAVAGSLTIAPTAVGAAATLNGNSCSMHVKAYLFMTDF